MPTIAVEPHCLLTFAAISDSDAHGAKLSQVTYEQLRFTLGKQASSQTLRKMADSGDPFTVPEQGGVDLEGWQRPLKEFEKLIEKKGWNTPSLRAQFLADLRQRAAELEGAAEVQTREIEEASPDFGIPHRFLNNGYTVSPDRRYLVISHCPLGNDADKPWTMSVTDLKTKVTITQPGGVGRHDDPIVSPDGKSLIFALEGDRIRRVPFENGVALWEQADSLGEHTGRQSSLRDNRTSADARYFFGGDGGQRYRFDLKSGRRVKLDPASSFPKGSTVVANSEYEVSPDGQLITIDVRMGYGTRPSQLTTFRIGEDGTLTKTHELAPLDGDPKELHVGDDGRLRYLHGEVLYDVLPGAKQGTKLLDVPKEIQGRTKLERRGLLYGPYANQVALVYSDRDFRAATMQVWDLQTKRLVTQFAVPGSIVKFSPDGAQAYAMKHTFNGKANTVEVLNLKSRW